MFAINMGIYLYIGIIYFCDDSLFYNRLTSLGVRFVRVWYRYYTIYNKTKLWKSVGDLSMLEYIMDKKRSINVIYKKRFYFFYLFIDEPDINDNVILVIWLVIYL